MYRSLLPFVLLAAGVLLTPTGQADNRAASFNLLPSQVPPNAPKSEFIDDMGFGKDPFFPNSSRRPKTVARPTQPEVVRATVPDFLALKGISVLKDRKLAIINTYTVAEGEDFSVRYGSQIVKVKCVEIKEGSVLVNVNGAIKELTLRQAFK
jgi:hypothetical protein